MSVSVTEDTRIDESLQTAQLLAQIADDYRGTDTVILDMRSVTSICDYFVLTSTTSNRQRRALGEEANRVMKQRGQPRLGSEGDESESVWLLNDYGDAVLHVFSPEGRELYDLERLWADAPRLERKA